MFASLHTSAHRLDRVQAGGWSAGLLRRLVAAAQLSGQRRRLASLDDRALEDIGVSREAARREAARPFWDAPAHWLH